MHAINVFLFFSYVFLLELVVAAEVSLSGGLARGINRRAFLCVFPHQPQPRFRLSIQQQLGDHAPLAATLHPRKCALDL